ncbi:MAG: sigma-54 interaction domain-containing protein [Leptospirillia bacterium]
MADGTDSAFLLIGSDYRIEWLSESALRLLGAKEGETVGIPCAHALKDKVCSASCLLNEDFAQDSDGRVFGSVCMEEAAGNLQVKNTLITDKGETVGLLKQISRSSDNTVLPATGMSSAENPSLEVRGSWLGALEPTLSRISPTTIPVLIVGETGTGKEVLAKRIHEMGPRKNKPFVVLDLSVIPETLIDDALFGHTRGAFTGAVADNPGKLLQADGGTLLLDELENIPLQVQAKLLRFLETGVIERIGQNRPTPLDVRVLAATNVSPATLLQTGRLREDLYYRLRGMTIELPPLRERREEIPLLVETFRGSWSARHKRTAPEFSSEIIGMMCQYPYPGNIRELRHIVELCLSLAEDSVLTPANLPGEIRLILESKRRPAFSHSLDEGIPQGASSRVGEAFSAIERDMIIRALAKHQGRIAETARSLAMSRITLWRKMKKYGMDRNTVFPV